jgi:hypothetical protein
MQDCPDEGSNGNKFADMTIMGFNGYLSQK